MDIVVLVDGSQRLQRARQASGWAGHGGSALSEQALVDLLNDRPDCVGIEVWNGDELIGYGHLAPPRRVGGTAAEIAAAPGVVRAGLIPVVLGAARDLGLASPIRVWTETEDEAGAARRWGMEPERSLHQVARPLPADWNRLLPGGGAIRPFARNDMEEWLAANNRAFADHPDNGAWSGADVEARMQLPWFNADGFLTAWHGDRLVGSNWTKIHPGQRGEIYVIFVDPPYQGRGWGRALAGAGLDHLAAAGCGSGFLYVEGTNERALALYAALGFSIESTAVAFRESVER